MASLDTECPVHAVPDCNVLFYESFWVKNLCQQTASYLPLRRYKGVTWL